MSGPAGDADRFPGCRFMTVSGPAGDCDGYQAGLPRI